jgi:hypothetical protein
MIPTPKQPKLRSSETNPHPPTPPHPQKNKKPLVREMTNDFWGRAI